MSPVNFESIVNTQRSFFNNGVTRSLHFRFAMLDMLDRAIHAKEDEIIEALRLDLGKPPAESYSTEIGFLYSEIRHIKRHLRFWSRSRRVGMPWYTLPAGARVSPTPYGVSLVIAPWNYPFQLAMAPVVAAAAAGNTVILKPSELAPHTADVLARMINEYFTPDFMTVVQGGAETSQGLIAARPDHIFYTGSTRVGKIIMKQAADDLIPVVLELGGKSPCIVLADADLPVAARRIVWGKFMNCGQTCVAPDYILVESPVREALVEELIKAIGQLYAPEASGKESMLQAIRTSPDYGRIINSQHFDRLKNYLDCGTVLFGGEVDAGQRYFSPTLIDNPSSTSALMLDEIFGPILPIIPFDDLDQTFDALSTKPAPLAFYLFTADRRAARNIMTLARFGGGCVNDTILHLANPRLPFGGVGESGMGKYHGKAGFEAFTHPKSVVTNTTMIDPPLRYPPFGERLGLYRRFL